MHLRCWFARKMSQFTHFCGVKFLAWKSGCVKFWTNFMSVNELVLTFKCLRSETLDKNDSYIFLFWKTNMCRDGFTCENSFSSPGKRFWEQSFWTSADPFSKVSPHLLPASCCHGQATQTIALYIMAAQYIWLLNIYDCSMLIFNLNCGCSWLIVEQGKLSEIAFSVVFENLQKKENKIFDQDDTFNSGSFSLVLMRAW